MTMLLLNKMFANFFPTDAHIFIPGVQMFYKIAIFVLILALVSNFIINYILFTLLPEGIAQLYIAHKNDSHERESL